MDQTAVSFFHQHPDALPLYAELESRILETIPRTRIDVRKTQISLFIERMYACVLFLRVRHKAEMPDVYIVVSISLDRPILAPRVAPPVQVSAHR